MQPPLLVRASREHCALLLCAAAHGLWATLGALPLIPHQGTSRCSIVALRPTGRIACFAPRLRVAVSATGRAPFRCLPVFAQSHAAELARPRYARTLRDSFMRPLAAWAWATLGALPLKPHQGTEFPGPSTFLPPACVRSYEPFHAAIDAESAFPTSKYNSAKSRAYPRPLSVSGILLRPARTEGT